MEINECKGYCLNECGWKWIRSGWEWTSWVGLDEYEGGGMNGGGGERVRVGVELLFNISCKGCQGGILELNKANELSHPI